jgi:ribonuclease P protein component
MQTPHLDVRYTGSVFNYPRVGVVVPKHKHPAVDRNRLRRQLRDLVRTELLPNVLGGDALIRAKAEAYEASFVGLRDEIGSIRAWISALVQQ